MKTLKLKQLFKSYLFLPVILVFGITTIIGSGGGGDGDGGGGGTSNTLVLTTNGNPDWVAMQDGDGAWSEVDPDVPGGNVYTRTIQDAAGRYGIAMHEYDASGNTHSITVLQSTLAELANPTSRPSVTEYDVTINGVNLIDDTLFSMSRQDTILNDVVTSGVIKAEAGINDLVAIENPGYTMVAPTRGVIKRNIDISGPTILNVDIDNETNVNSFTAHDFNITPQANSAACCEGEVKFVTANRTRSRGVTKGAAESPEGYYSLDSGTISSDYYSIWFMNEFDNGGTDSAIEIKRNSATPDLNFNFAAITPFSGANADASQITGLSYTPDPGMPALIGYQVNYLQNRVGVDRLSLSYVTTPGWLGSNSTYILPDFLGLPGFDPTWELTDSILTYVYFTAALYNVPLGVPLSTNTDWIPDMYMVQPMMLITFTP